MQSPCFVVEMSFCCGERWLIQSAARYADDEGGMNPFTKIRPTPAMSNTERQRQFRERNPGYYGRLHRKRNAAMHASIAAEHAMAAVTVVVREPLMLPAPVETIRIPGVNAIPTPQEMLAMRQLQAELVDQAAA